MKLIRRKKRISGSLGGDIFIFLVLGFLGIFMIFPFYFSVIQSIKPINELFIFPPKLYAMDPTADNFVELFRAAGNLWVPFSRYVFNSVSVAVIVTVTHVFIGSSAAYALAKIKFPGSKFANSLIVLCHDYICHYSSNVTGIMTYIVMAKMGMIDTYFALVLPFIATPMGLFLMRQFMGQIPNRSSKRQGSTVLAISERVGKL